MSITSAIVNPDRTGNKPQQSGSLSSKLQMFSKRVSDVLGKFIPFSYDSPSKNTGFQEGVAKVIAGTAMTIGVASASANAEMPKKPQENVFEPAFQAVKTSKSEIFEPLYAKQLSEREVERPLELGNLKQTNTFLKSMELPIVRKTKAYMLDGKYAEPMLKGTRVMLDSTKPVLVARDGKTYAHISGHNNTGDHVLESFLIRTTWLDDKIKAERTPKVLSKKSHFDGYIGHNGKELPAYTVENIAMNYFGKVIAPKVQGNIAKRDAELTLVRAQVKKEYMQYKMPIEQIPSYAKQKAILAKKHSLTQINQAIQSFVVNGSEALVNPDVEKLLESLKKTPDWQLILQQATAAENAKIRNRYRA